MNLFHHSSHHVRALALVVGGLCLLGFIIVMNLPVAIFPDLTIPRIIIAAEGGDAPTDTVLLTVTKPIEESISSVPGLKVVQSQTTRGSAGFTLTFQWGANMDATLQRVQSRLAEVRATLPSTVTVTAERLNTNVFPIIDYSVTSKTRSLADLRNLALYTLRPRLARLPGVARVMVNGGDVKELAVTIRPEQLTSHGLAMSQVEEALNKANTISAVGSYDQRYVRHMVLVDGLLKTEDDIRRVVVTVKNRIPITVGDVAVVSEEIQRRTVLATGHGQPAVLVNIVRQPEGNTVQVAEDVRKELDLMRSSLPADVNLNCFYDQSEIVRESESSVIEAIAIGGLLALIVIALFLQNMRTAFVALLILPLTLMITFAALRLMGMSLNIMTLGAIAIALGLVMDDAIVVVEHIYHKLETGDSKIDAISTGLIEITPAMFASSAGTIVTFLPLVLLPGVTGDFFKPLAMTLIATLLISLTLSITVIPVLAGYLFPVIINGKNPESKKPAKNKGFTSAYIWIARAALKHRWVVLALIIPVIGATYLILGKLQTGFMPEFDEGAFIFDYKMPAGTSLAETDRVMNQVEGILGDTEGVQTWSRLTGALSGSGLELSAQSQGDLVIRLKNGKRPAMDAVMDDVRGKVQQAVPDMSIDMIPLLGDLIGDMAGAPSPIEVKVYGPDIKKLKDLATEVGKRVASVPGVVDEADGITESGPETIVQVDPMMAANAGLSTDSIRAAAEGALDGSVAGNVQRGDLLEPIRVRYPFNLESTEEELSKLLLVSPDGRPIPVGNVARLISDPGTPELDRENQRLKLSVTARLSGVDLGSGVKAVKAKLTDLALPPGYSIEYGGLFKSQQESFGALGAVLASAALLVFCVLVFTFRSFRVAFSLFGAAGLSLFGVTLALWITGTPLNISSYTGAIMIVGIVTENGVLLFDEYMRRRRENPHAKVEDLLRESGAARLRPILMTTCAAILTLCPLALGLGAGAAMQKPLAVAVIGGLALSTVFTLLVAPVLYASMSSVMKKAGYKG